VRATGASGSAPYSRSTCRIASSASTSEPHGYSHQGLAGSAGILIGCAVAANEVHGAGLSPRQLRQLIGEHFGEERDGATVGVISHVEELRTRIPSRLQIVAGREGSRLAS
jgi:hypothetical protein